MKNQGQGGCLCLDAPVRALSRAADSAFDLYVNGMSGCAGRVPAAAMPGGRGAAFGRSATTVYLWASSDRREDLVPAPATPKQRRVPALEPLDLDVGAAKKGRLSQVAPEPLTARMSPRGGMLGTIAEDAPYEFGACAPRQPELRRSVAVDGLGTRGGRFGAIKIGSDAFARRA